MAVKVNIRPLGNRIVVHPIKENCISSGGIHIPGEQPQFKGSVKAVGPDVKEIRLHDVVLFGQYAGSKIEHNQTEYLVMDEDDIWGVLSD